MIDNLYETCKECKNGTYEEWCLQCDWHGTPIRCTNCKSYIDRYTEEENDAQNRS